MPPDQWRQPASVPQAQHRPDETDEGQRHLGVDLERELHAYEYRRYLPKRAVSRSTSAIFLAIWLNHAVCCIARFAVGSDVIVSVISCANTGRTSRVRPRTQMAYDGLRHGFSCGARRLGGAGVRASN